MSEFDDIAFGDMLYLVDVDHIGWYVVKECYWDIGIKRVGFIEDESISRDIASQDMHMVQKHICAAAVPGAIEALEQIAQSEVCVKETLVDGGKASFIFRPENNEFGYEAVRVASAALRAVKGDPA